MALFWNDSAVVVVEGGRVVTVVGMVVVVGVIVVVGLDVDVITASVVVTSENVSGMVGGSV